MSDRPTLAQLRTERYWRTATPAQRVAYSWLTGEDPPTARPAHEQRRRAYRKASAERRRQATAPPTPAAPPIAI